MECIEQLQSSHRRLCSLYNDLYSNQRIIVRHEFGSGRNLSISSLLKFAPIAENFQSYADDYKKELIVFQNLLNTVQQRVKKTNIKSSGSGASGTGAGQLNGSHPHSHTPHMRQLNGNVPATAAIIDGDDHKSMMETIETCTHRKNAPITNEYATPAHVARAYHHQMYEEEEEEEEDEEEEEELLEEKAPSPPAPAPPVKRLTDDQLFEMQMDDLIGFEVEDAHAIHEEDKEYQIQRNEMQQRDEAKRATIELLGHNINYNTEGARDKVMEIEIPRIAYNDLIASKSRVRAYTYKYRDTFDIFSGSEIYTSSMLRLSGCYGLKQDNEEDIAFVKEIMVSHMKFEATHIENIQIRDGRTWCIVYVRCSIKFIRDRIKRMEHKNKNIMKQNVNESNANAIPMAVYRLNEYQRRNRNINYANINNGAHNNINESNKLYILNFDVLNKNCHRAFTNLFLKFGDLADDIQIGINSRNDPFAKVLYKDIEDAKRLWTYQNFNALPNHKKIIFGKRELTIQYAKY